MFPRFSRSYRWCTAKTLPSLISLMCCRMRSVNDLLDVLEDEGILDVFQDEGIVNLRSLSCWGSSTEYSHGCLKWHCPRLRVCTVLYVTVYVVSLPHHQSLRVTLLGVVRKRDHTTHTPQYIFALPQLRGPYGLGMTDNHTYTHTHIIHTHIVTDSY